MSLLNVVRSSLLASLLIAGAAHAAIVPNGDFETGTFAGWTKSGNTSLSDVIRNTTTSNHTYLWRSGSVGTPSFISQTLNTQAGGTYTLEFDLFNSATANAQFTALFDGVTVLSSSNTPYNWVHFTFAGLVATGTSTELKFGARNDPSFYRLDNVSVTQTASAVPEPATLVLVLSALGAVGVVTRRRQGIAG